MTSTCNAVLLHCQWVKWKVIVYSLICAASRLIWLDITFQPNPYPTSRETIFNLLTAWTSAELSDPRARTSTSKGIDKTYNTSRLVQLTTITYISFRFLFSVRFGNREMQNKHRKNSEMICGNRSISINWTAAGRLTKKPISILQITIIKWIIGFFARVKRACQIMRNMCDQDARKWPNWMCSLNSQLANRQNVGKTYSSETGRRLVWVMKSFMQQMMVKCIKLKPNRIEVNEVGGENT